MDGTTCQRGVIRIARQAARSTLNGEYTFFTLYLNKANWNSEFYDIVRIVVDPVTGTYMSLTGTIDEPTFLAQEQPYETLNDLERRILWEFLLS